MKRICKYLSGILPATLALFAIQSCSEEWLEPKSLSSYTIENQLSDYKSFSALLLPCEKNMRGFFTGKMNPMTEQMAMSDVAVAGRSDWGGLQVMIDQDTQLTPQYPGENYKENNIFYHQYAWKYYWMGLRFAGALVDRLSLVKEEMTEDQKNEMLGQGYFHRAWIYYNLVNEFGDVPWMEGEPSQYKTDYFSYDRWSILEAIEKEARFAYEHLPEAAERGRVNKWGAGALYMKILMCNCKWDEAIKVGEAIISANPLMTTRMDKSKHNLQEDLHSHGSKFNMNNTEGIHYVVGEIGITGDNVRSYITRECTPNWCSSIFVTPEGKQGTEEIISESKYARTIYDNGYWYNRGQGSVRPSNYYQYDVWTEAEANDQRGRFNHDSWKGTWDLYYNQKSAGDYYLKPIQKPENMSVADTMQCWYAWPQYKLYVPDPEYTELKNGGPTPWYVYRTAEIYQLVAECYYWKGDLTNECKYLNPVRERAGARPYTGVKGIEEILAERARELFHEEFRHNELVRISYTYAKTGKPCEATGYTYTLDKFSGNGGENENLKANGYNFFYDWVTEHNGIFNRGIIISNYEYRMSVHHVLFPVPEYAIMENCTGTINQTPGYIAIKPRLKPKTVEK